MTKKTKAEIEMSDERAERIAPRPPVRREPVRREPELEEEAFDSTEDMLQHLSEEYNDGELRVEVFLVNDKTNAVERIGKYNYPGEFDPDVISEKFGGGKFRYIVKDTHGIIRKKFTITFARPSSVTSTAPAADFNAKILDMMEKRIADTETKAKDNVNQLTSVFQMMLAMTEKSNATVLQLLQGRKDPLEDILKYKQLFGSDDGLSKIEKLMTVLTTGAKLGEQYSDKGDNGGGLIEQVIAGVSSILASRGGGGANPNPPTTIGNALDQVRNVMTPETRTPEAARSPQNIVTPDGNVITEEPSADEPPPQSIQEYMMDIIGNNISLLKIQSTFTPPDKAAVMLGQLFNRDGVAWDVNAYFRRGGISEIIAAFPELKEISGWLTDTAGAYVKLFEPRAAEPKPAPASIIAVDAAGKPIPKTESIDKEKATDGIIQDTAGHKDAPGDRGNDAGARP